MLPVQHCYCLSVPGGLPCPAFHSIFLKYFYSFFFSFSNMLKQQSSRFTAAGREFFCEICFVSRSCEPLFLTVRKPPVFVVRYNMLKKIKRRRIFADFFVIFFFAKKITVRKFLTVRFFSIQILFSVLPAQHQAPLLFF